MTHTGMLIGAVGPVSRCARGTAETADELDELVTRTRLRFGGHAGDEAQQERHEPRSDVLHLAVLRRRERRPGTRMGRQEGRPRGDHHRPRYPRWRPPSLRQYARSPHLRKSTDQVPWSPADGPDERDGPYGS